MRVGDDLILVSVATERYLVSFTFMLLLYTSELSQYLFIYIWSWESLKNELFKLVFSNFLNWFLSGYSVWCSRVNSFVLVPIVRTLV